MSRNQPRSNGADEPEPLVGLSMACKWDSHPKPEGKPEDCQCAVRQRFQHRILCHRGPNLTCYREAEAKRAIDTVFEAGQTFSQYRYALRHVLAFYQNSWLGNLDRR